MHKRIIDTHVHIWDFTRASYDWLKNDQSILNRSYSIDEFDTVRQQVGLTEVVLVQAANNFEDTDHMLEVAANNDWVTGVVGWLPVTDPAQTLQVLQNKYLGNLYFKGVRHLIHDEPDARWLLQDTVIESLQILAGYHLPFDVVGILPSHIETVLEVASKVPDLKMVFDHLNQPPIHSQQKFGRWGELMMHAAKLSNFHMKISGLGTTCNLQNNWSANDIKPYIEFALDTFGVDRCFCGGDWPVSLLAGNFAHTWMVYQEVIGSLLNEADQEKVFYTNAQKFYQL